MLRPNQTLYWCVAVCYINDRNAVNDKINEMRPYCTSFVSTDPSERVLIEKEYHTGAYSHYQLPSYFLYVHWAY